MTAHELRVSRWIDPEGVVTSEPIRLADLGSGFRVIFCFQHWCPGCHSTGFPTLKRLVEKLIDTSTRFAAIQTVFEGEDQNTFEQLRVDQQRYDLRIPFGHDTIPQGETLPTFMADYHTHGTPWFVVIDPEGSVIHSDFSLRADDLVALVRSYGAPRPEPSTQMTSTDE